MTRMHDEREWCLFHNDLGQSVGECVLEVRGWLAEHPEYRGRIYGDWDTGGPRDNFDATAWFIPDADDEAEAPATIAEIAAPANTNPSLNDVTALVCADIVRTVRRVA